jgi:hypothetical protein
MERCYDVLQGSCVVLLWKLYCTPVTSPYQPSGSTSAYPGRYYNSWLVSPKSRSIVMAELSLQKATQFRAWMYPWMKLLTCISFRKQTIFVLFSRDERYYRNRSKFARSFIRTRHSGVLWIFLFLEKFNSIATSLLPTLNQQPLSRWP